MFHVGRRSPYFRSMHHVEDFVLEDGPLNLLHLTFYDERTASGSTRGQELQFEGKDYGGLSFRARLQANGRWRIGSLDLREQQVGYRSPRVDSKDPSRKRLVEAVRDLISQWWAVNGIDLSRRMLRAHECELVEAVAREEIRLTQDRRQLESVRAQLKALPAQEPEGPEQETGGEAISILLEMD